MRKRWNFSAPEFDALPWHHQRMYLELLWEELDAEQREQEERDGVSRVNAAGDVSAMGFTYSSADPHNST